ncbi:unnamed protein product, partial [Phaeothamnion confervicola]
RVQLLTLLGQCDFEAKRLAPSSANFEQALRLSETTAGALALRPDILCRAASVAAWQADASRAIRLAEAAVEEATRLGQVEMQARAWLQLATTLNQMDQQYRAEPTVDRAVELAHRTGLVEYEARAWRLMSDVQNFRRHYAAALISARRSIAMWVRCGKVTMLIWARLMELAILIESDQVEAAQAAAAALATHAGIQPAHVDSLQLLDALLDWKLGRTEASFATLHELADRAASDINMNQMAAHAELAFM